MYGNSYVEKKASHFYYYDMYDCNYVYVYKDIKNGEHFKDDVKDYIIIKSQTYDYRLYTTQIIFWLEKS